LQNNKQRAVEKKQETEVIMVDLVSVLYNVIRGLLVHSNNAAYRS